MVSLIEMTAILSAIAGIIAALLFLLQLRHMDQHRDLEISMKLFEWAETDRLRKALRWVEKDFHFENLKQQMIETEKHPEAGDYPYQVEAFFEEVGFLVNKKFVDIDVIVDRLGGYIVSNWIRLEPWILAIRQDRGDRTFGEHFQKLYQKTTSYMKRN